MRATDNVCYLYILIVYTTQLGKAKCGVFLYLFICPHYVHNTAIFMVIENIKPIIMKRANSTIRPHLLTLDKIEV